jgi:hypothetical protein
VVLVLHVLNLLEEGWVESIELILKVAVLGLQLT